MSVQLVIAEKPSVARSIAAVIGAAEKQNGYWQSLWQRSGAFEILGMTPYANN